MKLFSILSLLMIAFYRSSPSDQNNAKDKITTSFGLDVVSSDYPIQSPLQVGVVSGDGQEKPVVSSSYDNASNTHSVAMSVENDCAVLTDAMVTSIPSYADAISFEYILVSGTLTKFADNSVLVSQDSTIKVRAKKGATNDYYTSFITVQQG